MTIRRLVTGHDEKGRSVVVADGPPPNSHQFDALPGLSSTVVWATEPDAPVSRSGEDPSEAVTTLLGRPGATRLLVITLPPDAGYAAPGFDPVALLGEHTVHSPGLAESFEPDSPGFHTTETVDYGIVLDGEVCLELDDGATTALGRGDIVVQNGTRHAWRNPGDQPVTIAFVLIGSRHPAS